MTIPLFDVQCGFGGIRPGVREVVSAENCLAEMDRLGIDQALVRVTPEELDNDVPQSNALLYEAHRRCERLIPCPVVLPPGGGDLPDEETQVEQLAAGRAGAAVLRPQHDCWVAEEWSCGRLLAALEARAVPILCMAKTVSLPDVARIAGRHPALPIIVAQVEYRLFRSVWGLLESFPNTHVSIGSNLTVHRGIEAMVARFGPERLLFGTGWPDVEAMPAVTQLMYAEISDEQKRLIGSGNLRRLVEGVRR